MTIKSQKLIEIYRKTLFSSILPKSSENKLFPLIDINSVEKPEYYKEVLFSFLKHLSLTNSPIYKSRQDFLKYVFLDDKGKLCFHLNFLSESSTLLGGSKEDDPFYDPNNKKSNYKFNNINFAKVRKNLELKFFNGHINKKTNESKEVEIAKLSMENISITEFNDIFTPKNITDKDSVELFILEYKIKIEKLLNNIVVFNNFDIKYLDIKNANKEIECNRNNILNNRYIEFIDENDCIIESYAYNLNFDSIVAIGRIFIFNQKESKVVTEVNIIESDEFEFYLRVKTKEVILTENDYIFI